MKLRTSHRIITGAAALSLAFATPLALPGVVVPTAMAQTVSTIDNAQKATLTIHKYAGAVNSDLPNDGTELTNAPENTPLSGAKFQVQKINGLDVHKNADWKVVNQNKDNLDPTTWGEPGPYSLGEAKEKTTVEGVATFSKLELGFYLVTETEAPEGYTPAKPFIVSLPMTHRDNSAWNYEVHVYPKNNKFSTEKTVSDATKNNGDKIEYHIDTDIPATEPGQALEVMELSDHMDSRLTIASEDVSFQVIDGSKEEGAKDQIITSAIDAAEYFGVNEVTEVDSRPYVFAVASAKGKTELAKLKRANPNAKVRMILNPTVNLGETLSGTVNNEAYVWVNDPSQNASAKPTEDGPGDDPGNDDPGKTPKVKTRFGEIELTKTDINGENAANQQGAEFQLYLCKSAAEVETFGDQNGKPGITEGEALKFGGDEAKTFTIGKNGKVNIGGLHVQDFVNGKEVATNATPLTGPDAQGYCFVETKAPAGYEKLAQPIFFQLASSHKGDEKLKISVQDPDKNAGFELPLTGARGVILFALLGGGLLLLAGFVSRRNKKAAQ